LNVEVTNLSQHGFWLLVDGEELFVPFSKFPWFKAASVEQILDVQRPGPDHLFWPSLDVDLAIESIVNPGAFPLVSQRPPAVAPEQRRARKRPSGR